MPLLRVRRRPAPGEGPRAAAPDTRRLELGRRAIGDLLAPAAVQPQRDALRLDGGYARGLYVSGLPRWVGDGWLGPLLGFEEPLTLSQHITPLDSAQMVRDLANWLNGLEASRRLAERAGQLPSAARSMAIEDTERLQDQLTRGEEQLFSVGHYLQVRAPARRRLDDLTMLLEREVGKIQLHSRVALFEQDAAFHSCLPEGQDRLGRVQTLTTSALAASFPFDAGTLAMPHGVLYGLAKQSLVIFDLFDPGLTNANGVVIATSGAGKSFFVKLLVMRHLEDGVAIAVIDPDDEYGRVCRAVGGQYVRLALASDQAINPFDLPLPGENEPPDEARDPVAEQVDALGSLLELMLADPGRELSAEERATLEGALYETYRAAGIVPGAPDTWARPAPLLRDLAAQLTARPGATAASLALRLERYVTGSLAGLFNRPTNVDLDDRCVVFSIQRLDKRLQPLAINVISQFVWGRLRRSRRPRLLVVDEAWKLLHHPAGAEFLDAMARRARKYWLGVVTVVHSVEDLLGSPAGRTILGTAAVKMVMKQSEATIDAAVATFGLTDAERRRLLGAEKGEGLFFARGGRVPLKVVASTAEHELATTAPRELAALAAAARDEPAPLHPKGATDA